MSTQAPILYSAADLQAKLAADLQPNQLQVIDESAQHAGHAGAGDAGWGTHFRVRIASPQFAGLTRLARHRLVYDALQVFIAGGVHAIAIEVL